RKSTSHLGHVVTDCRKLLDIVGIRSTTSHSSIPCQILGAKTLKQKAKLSFPARARRLCRRCMHYEDKDLTTAIDLKTHKTVAEWHPNCGPDRPHGLQSTRTAAIFSWPVV